MRHKRKPLSWKWIVGLMLAVSFGLSDTAHSALCKYLDVTVQNVQDIAAGGTPITPSVGLFCENFTRELWRCYYNDPLFPADPKPSKWRTTIKVTNNNTTGTLSRTFNVNMGPLSCGSMEIVDLEPGLTASANCTRDEVPVVGAERSSNMFEVNIPSWADFTGNFKFRALVREVSDVGCN